MPVENPGSVTAVIPAYNEASHIGNLLTVLRGVPQLQKIVVVDDASTDETSAIVADHQQLDGRIQLVRLEQNQGKGGAVMVGIRASSLELLLLLDADLVNLRAEHVTALLQPVQQGEFAMTLGIFKNGRRQTNWTHHIFYFLSGQRCLRWSAFRQATAFEEARWGIEMALNLAAWWRGLAVQQVPWEGVSHVMRLEKMSGFGKYWTYVEMWRDIVQFVAKFSWQQWKVNGRNGRWIRELSQRQLSVGD